MAHKTLTFLLAGGVLIGLMGGEATATMQALNQETVIIGGAQSGLNGYYRTPVNQYQSPHASAPGLYPYTARAQKDSRPATLYYPPTSYPRSLMTVAGFASSAQPMLTERTRAPHPQTTNSPAGAPRSSLMPRSSFIGEGGQQQAMRKKPATPQAPQANESITPVAPNTPAAQLPAAQPTAPVRPEPIASIEPPAPPQPVATSPAPPQPVTPVAPVTPAETAQETATPQATALSPVTTGASGIITLAPPPTLEASLPPTDAPTESDPTTFEIVFDAQSFALDDADIAQLDRLAAAMSADEGLNIQLLAYAKGSDDQASQARRLSLSRALAVRGILMERGIRSTRMQVRALGNKTTSGNPDRVNIMPRP